MPPKLGAPKEMHRSNLDHVERIEHLARIAQFLRSRLSLAKPSTQAQANSYLFVSSNKPL
jgi:hypothetical protein